MKVSHWRAGIVGKKCTRIERLGGCYRTVTCECSRNEIDSNFPNISTKDLIGFGLGELSCVGRRSLRVERAMGIEPTGPVLPELENKRFGAMAIPKCD
jgi:hypothetical protein